MGFSYLQSIPDGLSSTQYKEWKNRHQTAERLLANQADSVPDAETITHLQRYVAGEITLGQAIGRMLDTQARHR